MESLTKQIDFTIKSNVDRSSKVNDIVEEHRVEIEDRLDGKLIEGQSALTKQLEQLADYILYGKDVDEEKSAVDKKELIMTPKYGSFKKKEPESLDAILENPAHDERSFKSISREVYTNPKPTIDREKDAHIPGLPELWDVIDELDLILKKIGGKVPWDEGEPAIELSSYNLFKSRHWLIELRKQQYVLKEEFNQPIRFKGVQRSSNRDIDWESDAGYAVQPIGQCTQDSPGHWHVDTIDDTWEWCVVREHTIDLSDPKHIQELINNYSKLKQDCYDNLQSNMKYILWTLEDLIDGCGFSEVRMDIIYRKIDGQTNVQLHEYLIMEHGLTYSANYISTIFTHEICGRIAKRFLQSYDEWKLREDLKAWKVCTKCGERKLANNDNFTKKKSSKDGLNTRCKLCEKEIRKVNK